MRSFHHPGRSPVYATNAMCATSHPLATLAAIEALKDGGNAVDAAICAAAVLGVVEPHMTGIGGDCFAIIAHPDGRIVAMSGAGRAPRAADAEALRAQGLSEIAATSPHAVTVPAAIAAWDKLAREHGRLGLARLLAPAITHAEEGFVVAPRVAVDWRELAPTLAGNAGACRHLLTAGEAPGVGAVVRFPALVETLRTIAREGRAGFYEGAIAEDMVATLQALGGVHTLDDFAAQDADYVEVLGLDYGGGRVLEFGPPNQGVTALLMLNVLKALERRSLSFAAPAKSAKRAHVLMEVARAAYGVRDAHVADPGAMRVSAEALLSDAFADAIAAQIDPERRNPRLRAPAPMGSDTVTLAVVDRDGLAVSIINSLYKGFGSAIVTEKTGIVLHCRGAGFVLDPAHPNCLGPGKRPFHTLVPAMMLDGEGAPRLAFGVMGADYQPMGHVWLLTNLLDHGMDLQEAIDFPRIFFAPDSEALGLEQSVPAEVAEGLRAMGHEVVASAMPWGGAQAVLIDRRRGVLVGGSDPRKDGLALGY